MVQTPNPAVHGFERKSRITVLSVGINDVDYRVLGCPTYSAWHHMLRRCYCEKTRAKKQSFIGLTCDPVWQRFTAFMQWFEEHSQADRKPDKDLKFVGNKHYSPDTCLVIPNSINCLFNNQLSQRAALPVRVNFHSDIGRYQAQRRSDGVCQYIGLLNTPEEAHAAYVESKNAETDRRRSGKTTSFRNIWRNTNFNQ